MNELKRQSGLMAACLIVGLTSLATACGTDTKLDGSLGQSYDLSFELVRARLYPTELSIEYVREDGEVLVRVGVRTTDTGLEGPATVDLERYGSISGSCAGNEIPALISGTLYLRGYAPEEGAEVFGDFEALLEGTRGDLTLYGEFSTTLDIVQ